MSSNHALYKDGKYIGSVKVEKNYDGSKKGTMPTVHGHYGAYITGDSEKEIVKKARERLGADESRRT